MMGEEAKTVPQFSAPKKTKSVEPPIIVIHGPPGVGKTTFAASAPDALFLFTENGQRDLEVQTILDRPFENLSEFIAGLDYVGRGVKTGEIKTVKTLVIDSLDHLETLVVQSIVEVFRQRAFEDGFSEEQVAAITGVNEIPAKYNFDKWPAIESQWEKIWKRIARLRALGVAIVGLCHSHLKQIDDPASDEPYYRHELKLDPKRAQKLWVDNADLVGFIRYPSVTDANTKRTSLGKSPWIEIERAAAWMSKPNFKLTRHKLDKPESGFMDTFGTAIPYYAAHQKSKAKEQAK